MPMHVVAATAVCTILAALCYFLYRTPWTQPPIPGIPYSHEARNSFLGDLPAMLAHGRKQPSTWYFQDQCIKHNTAIMQFWVRPFARPWVVVTDGREGQDAMTRRSKTFDRSRELSKLAIDLPPKSTADMKRRRFPSIRSRQSDHAADRIRMEVQSPTSQRDDDAELPG